MINKTRFQNILKKKENEDRLIKFKVGVLIPYTSFYLASPCVGLQSCDIHVGHHQIILDLKPFSLSSLSTFNSLAAMCIGYFHGKVA